VQIVKFQIHCEGFPYANVSYSSEKIAKNRTRVLSPTSAEGYKKPHHCSQETCRSALLLLDNFLNLDTIFLDTRLSAYDVMQVKVLTRRILVHEGGEGFCSHCLAKLGSRISVKFVLISNRSLFDRFGVRGVLNGATAPIDNSQLMIAAF
jgi:hypothetical protein